MTANRRGARGQAGVTMVEMAVVVALLGLVLAMAMQGSSPTSGLSPWPPTPASAT